MTLLSSLQQRLHADTGLQPVIASEIEFYLFGANACADLPVFWERLKAECPVLEKIEIERGIEQFEVALPPVKDAALIVQQTKHFQHSLIRLAQVTGMQASFAARPVADQPGSGLHVHVHLEDGKGVNVFTKQEQVMSDALRHSLGGLLASMAETMVLFAPCADSYARIQPKSNAPITISWGANNRTVALRLPDKPHARKHIEHRVAGADADCEMAIAAILAGMHWGLTHKAEPGVQIYGDASLPMYNLPKLPLTLEEARETQRAGRILSSYFDVEVLWQASERIPAQP